MNCEDLTFIATTNSRNFAFTLPFIYFAAKYNPNCKIDLYLYDDCNLKLAITEDDCHSRLASQPSIPASSKSFD